MLLERGSEIVEALLSLMLLSFALGTIFSGERALLRYLPREADSYAYRSAIEHMRELIRAQLALDPDATAIVLRPPMTPFEARAHCSHVSGAAVGRPKRCVISIEIPTRLAGTELAEVTVWTP